MSISLIVAVVAAVEIALGVLLYVTIRQIQTITAAMDAIDKMACDAKAKAERNSRKIEDCCTGIQLISRDTDEAYSLAAECRNELTRQHMIMRKETEK